MKNAPALWQEVEEDILRKWYEGNGSDFCDTVIHRLLGWRRGNRNVMQKAHKLGLHYKGPRRGVFKKGLVPFNKGRKMPAAMYEQCAPTMFKKGHLPKNTKEADGAITIRYDNRGVPVKHIRQALGKWEYLSRHVWRQSHGEIPKGHIVIHRDGDSMNCDIDNLEMITRAENARRNYNKEKIKEGHRNLTDEYVFRYYQRYKKIRDIDFEDAKANGLLEIWRAEIQLKRQLSTIKINNNNGQRNKKTPQRGNEKTVGVHD